MNLSPLLDEEEIRKKKSLVLVVALLFIPTILGLYTVGAVWGQTGAAITPTAMAGVTPGPTDTNTPPPTTTPTSTSTTVPSSTPTTTATPTPSPTATPTLTVTPVEELVIVTPEDNETVNIDRPPVEGTASPGATVQVYVDENLVGTTTADETGNWSVIPEEELTEGEHIITAQMLDEQGAVVSSDSLTFHIVRGQLPVTGGSAPD